MKIKRQVQLISFFSCLFPILIIFIFSSRALEKEIKVTEGEKLEAIFSNVENDLMGIFRELNIYLEILDEINHEEGKDMLIKHMTDFSSQSSKIMYFALGDEKGDFYLEEWVKDDFPDDYDPRIRPWYRGALEQDGRMYMSDIYTHAATGRKILTASISTEDSSGTRGVLAVLINLEDINHKLGEFKLESEGRFLVIDSKGKIVLGKDYSRYEDFDFFSILSRNTLIHEDRGIRYYVFSEPLEKMKLSLVGVVPYHEVLHVLSNIKKIFSLITAITLVIALCLTSVLIERLAGSLNRIAYIIDNIARGNYSKNVKKLTRLIDDRSELYLVKEGINRMQSEIEKREKKLKLIAETDALTNIYNRGAIMKLLEIEVRRSREFQTEFSLIMFDLDKFKVLNDNYGHQFGDTVLRGVSSLIKNELKRRDLFGRYGGEEFLIILPDTPLQEAVGVAERLRGKVENLTWEYDIRVTISLGVEEYRDEYSDDTLISAVDGLLYRAKDNGRNRVEHL